MRYHAFAAMGLVTAAILAPGSSQAAAVDPTGYWYKPDAVRESKIQVFKCGSGKSQLCAKIAWLKDPNDTKGKPLHDIRNENPSMHDRPIVGLTLFSGMQASAPGTWTGQIYNPEDGHTYAATLTMISRSEIKLRGCKAWLLCGEKQWLRTSAPPAAVPETAPEGTQQIEASATPAQPAPAAAVATAPVAAPKAEVAAASPAPAPKVEVDGGRQRSGGYHDCGSSTDDASCRQSYAASRRDGIDPTFGRAGRSYVARTASRCRRCSERLWLLERISYVRHRRAIYRREPDEHVQDDEPGRDRSRSRAKRCRAHARAADRRRGTRACRRSRSSCCDRGFGCRWSDTDSRSEAQDQDACTYRQVDG